MRQKRYFYALRLALALRWLRTRPDAPPMDLLSLRTALEPESELDRGIENLTALKALLSEMGTGPRIGMLDRFLEAEFAAAARPRGRTGPRVPGSGSGSVGCRQRVVSHGRRR